MKKENTLKLFRAITPIICLWFAIFCCAGQAQGKDEKPGLFIGVGGGLGDVKKLGWETASDIGANLKFLVGFGLSSRALFMIEYEIHHIRDETPELSEIDYYNRPSHFKTYFLLASIQIYLYKGFFIRPSVGYAKNCRLWSDWDYRVYPPRCIDASVRRETKLAWGISVGYEYKLTQHIGVALETVARRGLNLPWWLGEDSSTAPRRAFGIQVVGTWYF